MTLVMYRFIPFFKDTIFLSGRLSDRLYRIILFMCFTLSSLNGLAHGRSLRFVGVRKNKLLGTLLKHK
jgi:hypothetical protein